MSAVIFRCGNFSIINLFPHPFFLLSSFLGSATWKGQICSLASHRLTSGSGYFYFYSVLSKFPLLINVMELYSFKLYYICCCRTAPRVPQDLYKRPNIKLETREGNYFTLPVSLSLSFSLSFLSPYLSFHLLYASTYVCPSFHGTHIVH